MPGEGGHDCTVSSVTRRLAVEHVRVCQINLENVSAGSARPAGPVSCVGAGRPLLFPDSLAKEAFTEVGLGTQHVCAIRAADEVAHRRAACWGTATGDQFQQISMVPDAGLHSLCSGSYFSCAIVTDGQGRHDEGTAVCWGESEIVAAVEHGSKGRRLRELACGSFAVCGLVAASGLVRI
jgi:hypothetical protein